MRIKFECHRLLEIIWGESREERRQAYTWLHENVGINHFADVKDYETIWNARKKLQAEALSRGILTIEELSFI